jgi:hypothetical protein
MSLISLLELAARVPFLGRRAVRFGIKRGTQRFGCSGVPLADGQAESDEDASRSSGGDSGGNGIGGTCGLTREVPLQVLLSDAVGPMPLLVDGARTLWAVVARGGSHSRRGSASPTHRSTSRSSSRSASVSEDEDARENETAGIIPSDFVPDELRCERCGSRMGLHLYPGDAVNGEKSEIMRLIVLLLRLQPELLDKYVAHHLEEHGLDTLPVDLLALTDVFWSDHIEFQRSMTDPLGSEASSASRAVTEAARVSSRDKASKDEADSS